MARRAEEKLGARFREIDETAEKNTRKVMEAFQNNRVSEACFAGTTGYGYDDLGRETLDKIYADIFGTEAALVRIQFVNGTHALTAAMFSLAEPGQKILAVTGMPYDTLRTAIGISGDCFGSLKFYGIDYGQVDLAPDGGPDYDAIREAVREESVVTSGVYERFFVDDGVTYHHLLDPKTGLPLRTDLLAVSVVGPCSARCDALSTVCFALGPEDGPALMDSLEGYEAVFIREDKTQVKSAGFAALEVK